MKSRLNTFIAAALGTALLGGCAGLPIEPNVNQPADQLNDTPLVIDGAMQLREWDRSVANYSNGNTVANPTLYAYRSVPTNFSLENAAVETPLFIAQVLALPINAVRTPPWQTELYTGVSTPPTFNAMPPLPPSDVPVETPQPMLTQNEPPATQPAR